MLSQRLQKCFDAGSVVSLFGVLADWPREEIQALLSDLTAYEKEQTAQIDALYQQHVFRPENFLSRHNSGKIDAAHKDARLHLLAVCSEIASVALHYLA